MTNAEIKLYKVKIKYFTENFIEYDTYASSESQAMDISLVRFKDGHTEKCQNPEIVNVGER